MSRVIGRLVIAASLGVTAMAAASGNSTDAGQIYTVQGAKLYGEISGSGPPVLFLHGGLSFFDRSFGQQGAYFSTFRTVIGIDQRGHGHSPDTDQPFSYREMAENTAAVIQRLDLGPVDVVGHSDGGNVALLLARYHPELVRRLVISGANFRGDFKGTWPYLRLLWQSDQDFTAGLPPALRQAYAKVSPDGDAHWLTFAGKTKQLWSTWELLKDSDLRDIRVPVLVMAGDRDVVSLEHTLEIFHALPQGRLCILPGSGHDTMLDRPEDFNRLVREFLEQPR